MEQRQEQFETLCAHLIIGLPDCSQRWPNMYGRLVIVKSHQRYVLWDSYPVLFGRSQHTIGHLVGSRENSCGPLLQRELKEFAGAGTSCGWQKVTLQYQFGIKGNAHFQQCLAVAIVAIMRGQVFMRACNMRDSPVTKLNEMPHNHIRTRRIINSHPRRRLLYLIINDYLRKSLVIQARQNLGSWAGEDR